MSTVISFILGLAIGVPGMIYAERHPAFGVWWWGAWAIVCTALAVLDVVLGWWAWAAWMGGLALLEGWWWHAARKRKRTVSVAP